jgi:hypothetical protein
MIQFFWRFLRESEKTRAKSQGIYSGLLRIPNQNAQKKQAFQTKIGGKGMYETHFFSIIPHINSGWTSNRIFSDASTVFEQNK